MTGVVTMVSGVVTASVEGAAAGGGEHRVDHGPDVREHLLQAQETAQPLGTTSCREGPLLLEYCGPVVYIWR